MGGTYARSLHEVSRLAPEVVWSLNWACVWIRAWSRFRNVTYWRSKLRLNDRFLNHQKVRVQEVSTVRWVQCIKSLWIPFVPVSYRRSWVYGVLELCPGVPKNSVRNVRCFGFFWITEKEYFWQCCEHVDFPTVGGSIHSFRTAILIIQYKGLGTGKENRKLVITGQQICKEKSVSEPSAHVTRTQKMHTFYINASI
jgi:hypothetical protein